MAKPLIGPPDAPTRELLRRISADLFAALEGLPYLFARSTYADEQTLHFGAERGYSNPRLEGKIRGTHVLSVRGSVWSLYSAPQRAIITCAYVPAALREEEGKPFNVTALESGAFIGRGATIKSVRAGVAMPLNSIALEIELSDDSRFNVIPTPMQSDDTGLPEPSDWEVLTPEKTFRAGPGLNYDVELLR